MDIREKGCKGVTALHAWEGNNNGQSGNVLYTPLRYNRSLQPIT
jgi:hypothetical protein